jgi:hypothetical protein
MNLQHSSTSISNVLCSFDLNEKKELTLETIEVPSLQQEQIDQEVNSHIETTKNIALERLDNIDLENLSDSESESIIVNIVNVLIQYPGFASLIENIAKGNISFDVSAAKESYYHKTNESFSIILGQNEREQFDNVFLLINKNTTISGMSKTIEEFLEEKSKNNTVSVSLSDKASIVGKNMLIVHNAKPNVESTQKTLFNDLINIANIINSFLAKPSTKQRIKTIIISTPCYAKAVTTDVFLKILFALFELNKMMSERAVMDVEHKFNLFYCFTGNCGKFLNILYKISKPMFVL